MTPSTEQRLLDLERKNRGLVRQVRGQFAVLVLAGAALVAGFTLRDDAPRLTVSELVVVDPNGVERVRIGGDLPDAVTQGRTINRGEKAAGVLIYDAAGHERGGYVTMEPSGNALLTLDDRNSRQKTLFVAGPDIGSALQVWEGDALAELRADGDGARLSVTAGGRVVEQTPQVRMGAEACSAYRGALSSMARSDVASACNARFTPEVCSVCLTD